VSSSFAIRKRGGSKGYALFFQNKYITVLNKSLTEATTIMHSVSTKYQPLANGKDNVIALRQLARTHTVGKVGRSGKAEKYFVDSCKQLSGIVRKNARNLHCLDNTGGMGISGSLSEASMRALVQMICEHTSIKPHRKQFIDIGAGVGGAIYWYLCICYEKYNVFPPAILGVELNQGRFDISTTWYTRLKACFLQVLESLCYPGVLPCYVI
jgi:hypothetical protein